VKKPGGETGIHMKTKEIQAESGNVGEKKGGYEDR
jgi:hypothetical protein